MIVCKAFIPPYSQTTSLVSMENEELLRKKLNPVQGDPRKVAWQELARTF